MSELTLESLAARVAELERKLAHVPPPGVIAPTRDWRTVAGVSDDDEFERLMQAEIRTLREAERVAEQGSEGNLS